MAKKDLKFFMRTTENKIVTAPAPASFKDDDGNPIELEIKVLSQAEIENINDNYTRRTIAIDKKGNPIVANNEVVWKTEKDSAKVTRHILVEALQYPNLKDKELMEYYKCVDITEMPNKVFPSIDEFQEVINTVWTAIGLRSSLDDEELIEEVKN